MLNIFKCFLPDATQINSILFNISQSCPYSSRLFLQIRAPKKEIERLTVALDEYVIRVAALEKKLEELGIKPEDIARIMEDLGL